MINSRLIADVEAAISDGDPQRRMKMLRSITLLFTGQVAHLSEEQISAFDTVILRLASDIELEARQALADQLADTEKAPRRVVRDLALDPHASVAGPILERSPRLDEGVLLEVARGRGQQHLMALSRRSALTSTITDVLVDRGDQDVVRSVARNATASFSMSGHRTMVERSMHDETLLSTLQSRGDVPPTYRSRLMAIAKERANAALQQEFGGTAEAAVGLSAVAVAASISEDAIFKAEFAVTQQANGRELSEATINAYLDAGRETEALVVLARLAGVPTSIALQAYEAGSYEPLLFLIRSARLGWRVLKLFVTLKAGRAPEPETMQGMIEAFQALSVATAQRVTRFTAARETVKATELGSNGP